MSKPSTKPAASSTPAAAPTGSQPEELKKVTTPVVNQGADTEEITASDIDAALGQLSEAPKAGNENDDSDDESTEEATAEAGAETAEETEAGAADESAESEAEAEAGDAEAETSGDDDESTEETAADDESAPENGESPKPEKAQQRINELVSRSKVAEEALARARETLAAVEAEASGQLDAGPMEAIDSLEVLAKKRSNIVKLHQWALAHRDGGELPAADGKSAPLVYDADGVSGLLSGTFELIHETLPAREKYLRDRDKADADAVTAYPWLKDTRNDQAKQVQAAIEAMPAIRRLGPNYRIVAADALIGQTFREAGIPVDGKLIERLKTELKTRKPGVTAKVTPKVVAPGVRKVPPSSPARPGVVPARVTAGAAAAQAANKRLRKGDGNVNDLASSIAAGL